MESGISLAQEQWMQDKLKAHTYMHRRITNQLPPQFILKSHRSSKNYHFFLAFFLEKKKTMGPETTYTKEESMVEYLYAITES